MRDRRMNQCAHSALSTGVACLLRPWRGLNTALVVVFLGLWAMVVPTYL